MHVSKLARTVFLSVAILLAGTIVIYISFRSLWNKELTVQGEAVFVVSPGDSAKAVARNLAAQGYISRPMLFQFLLRLNGFDRLVKPGSYQVLPGIRLKEFTSDVLAGQPDTVDVLIIEGAADDGIVAALSAAGISVTPTFEDMFFMADEYKEYWFLKGFKQGDSLLGYLFPDTYSFARESKIPAMLHRMLSNTEHKLAELGITDPAYLSPDGFNIHEILTLASIVQNESGDGEMDVIAGVFINRLRNGWRLESDATVNFILGSSKLIPSGKDIRADSPYNTYLSTGLPPGPIGNPGLEAIRAVLNPVRQDYYFFLHTPDSSIVLSKTFEEHLAARAEYWE